jgi:hypothetical protein
MPSFEFMWLGGALVLRAIKPTTIMQDPAPHVTQSCCVSISMAPRAASYYIVTGS